MHLLTRSVYQQIAFFVRACALLLFLALSACSSDATNPQGNASIGEPPVEGLTTPLTGKIVFVSSRSGSPAIYAMAADGSNITRLTRSGTRDTAPIWSLDGTRIAFISERDGNAEIYVMQADGSGQTRLTNNASRDSAPTWSPDGSHIAFVSERDGNAEVYVMQVDGSFQTRLTGNATRDSAPAWSPDGKQIAFVSGPDGAATIMVMQADGSEQRRLTQGTNGESAPAWSPDGKQIAYVLQAGSNADIYVANVVDGASTRLTDSPAQDVLPAWSPDGTHIAFISDRTDDAAQDNHAFGIYTVAASGGAAVRLSSPDSDDYGPVWSPDGRGIAFMAAHSDHWEIYVMTPDGAQQSHLTSTADGDDWSPRWATTQ